MQQQPQKATEAARGAAPGLAAKVVPVPVRLEKLVKRFGTVVAVDGVTLEIPAGKLVTLLGPSGCARRRRCA